MLMSAPMVISGVAAGKVPVCTSNVCGAPPRLRLPLMLAGNRLVVLAKLLTLAAIVSGLVPAVTPTPVFSVIWFAELIEAMV